MRSAPEFRRTIRRGVRTGRSRVVVSALRTAGEPGVRVGFVVSKAVGNAVVRNRVKRRLRHLSRPLVDETPPGTRIVVRALPPAANAAADDLADDVSGAWRRCLAKIGDRTDSRRQQAR